MRQSISRVLKWLAIVCGGAALFQFPITGNNGVGGGGCSTFATNGLMNSIDFCYLLDCENGFFGGAVQPCGDGSSNGQAFLLDCTSSTSTGTSTGTSTSTSTGTSTSARIISGGASASSGG